MLKIIWNSDKMIGGTSAYSKVTYEVLTRLCKKYCISHVPMGMTNKMGKWYYSDILIYPSGADPFNEDVIVKHYIDYCADILITLKDPWVFRLINNYALNWVPHAIIDHSPVNPLIISSISNAFKVITVSRFAQRELKKFKIESTYIPHGVDIKKYIPMDKKECKKAWYIPEDDFTVLFIGRNQSRKMIPQILKTYKKFVENNKDIKTHLFLWTDINPTGSLGTNQIIGVADIGVNLLPEILNLGIGNNIMFPDREHVIEGIQEVGGTQSLVTLYNAADVVISLSGEGFWMPGIEAQACGVPIICADYAATTEICSAGYTIPVIDYVILNTPGSRYPICDTDKAAEAMSKIANSDPKKFINRGRAFAMNYDWDKIIEKYWIPFLDSCEMELYPVVKKDGVGTW